MRAVLAGLLIWIAQVAQADLRDIQFPSIEGGVLEMSAWEGRPVLVVNTASQCAFTDQYEALQTLYDTYRNDGLVVLAVPSDTFRQELDSAEEVQEFCELAFGLDMPMTAILQVSGDDAHPFYAKVRAQTGFVPRWNFNKVLIGADGDVVATWRARISPLDQELKRAIEGELSND